MSTVHDYNTADRLAGTPSPELAEASAAEGPVGAVAAYLDGEVWQHVPENRVSHYRDVLGRAVRTVYVAQ